MSVEDAIVAVELTFAAMARGVARNYPVVREVVGYQDAVFGVKTGADVSAPSNSTSTGPRHKGRESKSPVTNWLETSPRIRVFPPASPWAEIRKGGKPALPP